MSGIYEDAFEQAAIAVEQADKLPTATWHANAATACNAASDAVAGIPEEMYPLDDDDSEQESVVQWYAAQAFYHACEAVKLDCTKKNLNRAIEYGVNYMGPMFTDDSGDAALDKIVELARMAGVREQ